MRVDVLGCRGSFPVDGAAYGRYGGATSSLAFSPDGHPTLLVDGGTGLRHLGTLTEEPFRGAVVLGHLHWDHILGLPFCPQLDHPGAMVDVFLPSQGRDATSLISRFMSPPMFPIGPEGLQGRWRFHSVEPGTFEVGGLEVTAFEVPHKGGRTYGFRVSDGKKSVAYVSDHAPGPPGSGPRGVGEIEPELVEALQGVDHLFHDAQHLDAEFPALAHLGHSTVGYALDLAERAGVARLILFHHDPNRADDELDAVAAGLPAGTAVAWQGMSL